MADHVLQAPEKGRDYFYPATADGTALALAGFGFGLMMLSIINAEWIKLQTIGIVVPVALGFAAVGTILGGLWSFRANNLFSATWGICYGGFWISAALILRFFAPGLVTAAGVRGFSDAFGAYLLIWAVLTAYLTVAAYFVARPAFIAFVLLFAVFVLVGLSNIISGDPSDALREIGGYVGIVDALVAFYVSAVLVINTTSAQKILPLWPYPYGKS